MNLLRTSAIGILAISLALLTACGGGGGGSNVNSTGEGTLTDQAHSTAIGTSDVQGAYQGTMSNGFVYETIIIDNDEYFTLYGQQLDGTLYVSGFQQGNGRSVNGTFTSSNLRDFEVAGVFSGSLSASYIPGASFNGTFTKEGFSIPFAESSIPIYELDYNKPASLSRITGTWQMAGTIGDELTVTIDSNGTLSGSSGDCTFNGTIKPRASGKNVFDLNVEFGPSPCTLANQSISGIAVESDLLGTQQLIAFGVDNSRSQGTVIFGTRNWVDPDDLKFNPDRSLAQGMYDGTITYTDLSWTRSLDFNQQTVVLENGEFFIIYGKTMAMDYVYYIDGFLHGTGQISLGTNRFYSSDLADYFFDPHTLGLSAVTNGVLSASFSANKYFSGAASQQDTNVEFAGTTPAMSVYNYNATANLAAVSGTWTVRDLIGTSLTLSVDPSGNLAGSYRNGCTMSGTLIPRASNKNVFNAAFSYGPAPCAQPNLTFSGIAIDYTLPSQSHALLVAGITATNDMGATLFGTR